MKTLARLYWKRLAAILVAQASPRDQENIQKILSTMRPERDFGKNVYLITWKGHGRSARISIGDQENLILSGGVVMPSQGRVSPSGTGYAPDDSSIIPLAEYVRLGSSEIRRFGNRNSTKIALVVARNEVTASRNKIKLRVYGITDQRSAIWNATLPKRSRTAWLRSLARRVARHYRPS